MEIIERALLDLTDLIAGGGLTPPQPPPDNSGGSGGGGGGGAPLPTPTPTPFAPNPRLVSPQNITVEAGQTLDVEINLRNIGTHTAFNVLTQASVSSGSPFNVEFLNNSNNVNQIQENRERSMTMRISVDNNASPGTHSISLTHLFRNQGRENLSTTDTINVRIGGISGAPVINLGGFSLQPAGTIAPGDTFTVSANIGNAGGAPATAVQVALVDMSPDRIFFTGDLNQAAFANMPPGHSNRVDFRFTASNAIQSGGHRIAFRVSYRGVDGEALESTFETWVTVIAPEDGAHPNLEIRGITSPTGTVGVGQTGNISFYLYNSGDIEVRNIRVDASPENDQHIVPMTASLQTVNSLAPGEQAPLSFGFSPTDASSTRNYFVRFNVSFEVGRSGDAISFDRFASFNVNNPEREAEGPGRQIPRVIVSAFTVTPQIPRAGQEFDMEITFRNTNPARSVNNIRITLEALEAVQGRGAVFTPAGGSNTVFIDYLAPGGEYTKTLTFFTVLDADPRSYNLAVRFDYQDQDFVEFTANEQLSITVAQVTRLESDQIPIPDFVTVGQNIFFEMRVINSGRVDLTNVRVRLDGPWDGREAEDFIGNLRAQATIMFRGQFTPWEEGNFDGAIVIYGEDTTGAIVEFVHDFNLTVGGGMDWDDGGFGMDWDDGGFGMDWDDGGRFPMDGFNGDGGDGFFANFGENITRPIVWGPIAGVVIVVVIVAVSLVRRKKSRLDFDEES